MGIGTSIFLFAIGAILRFAVNVTTEGIDLQMVGVILMIVGVVGAMFSLMFWNTWGGFGSRDAYDNGPDVIVERERPRRTVIVEKEQRA